MLGVESAEPEWALPVLEALAGRVYRLRVVGSIAITAAYVGAGRFDGMLSLRPCRSVDAAAAQLIVREAGGVVAFGDLPLEEASLGLDARYPIAAAADRARAWSSSAARSGHKPRSAFAFSRLYRDKAKRRRVTRMLGRV